MNVLEPLFEEIFEIEPELLDRLDKVKARISEPAFLANKGLSNEVGIHVFCYDPEDDGECKQ